MNTANDTLIQPRTSVGLQQQTTVPAKKALRLWLVDDHDGVRGLLADLLYKPDVTQCSRQFSSAEAMLDALAQETPPDVIVTDLNLGGMSGIDAIRPAKALASSTRVFVITTFYDSEKAALAFKAGASGFLLKRDDVELTVERISRAFSDPVYAETLRVPMAWRSREGECELAASASSPGWQNHPMNGFKSATPAAQADRPPSWLARGLNLVRTFLARNRFHQPPVTSETS
jgi:DNA-binding NarL/FixJ family response regulator